MLKKKMTTTLILGLLDFSKEFIIECGASKRGLGVVLMQEGCLLAYFSKALCDRNLSKSTYEKELMALALVVSTLEAIFTWQTFYGVLRSKKLETTMTTMNYNPRLAMLVSKDIGIPI